MVLFLVNIQKISKNSLQVMMQAILLLFLLIVL